MVGESGAVLDPARPGDRARGLRQRLDQGRLACSAVADQHHVPQRGGPVGRRRTRRGSGGACVFALSPMSSRLPYGSRRTAAAGPGSRKPLLRALHRWGRPSIRREIRSWRQQAASGWLRWAAPTVPRPPRKPRELGKAMLNKYARAFFTRVLTPFAALLIRLGVSPDAVTLVGTGGVVAGALAFYPTGRVLLGNRRHHALRLLRPRRRQYGPAAGPFQPLGRVLGLHPGPGGGRGRLRRTGDVVRRSRGRPRAVRGEHLLPRRRPGGLLHQGARRGDRAARRRQRAGRARRTTGHLPGPHRFRRPAPVRRPLHPVPASRSPCGWSRPARSSRSVQRVVTVRHEAAEADAQAAAEQGSNA